MPDTTPETRARGKEVKAPGNGKQVVRLDLGDRKVRLNVFIDKKYFVYQSSYI